MYFQQFYEGDVPSFHPVYGKQFNQTQLFFFLLKFSNPRTVERIANKRFHQVDFEGKRTFVGVHRADRCRVIKLNIFKGFTRDNEETLTRVTQYQRIHDTGEFECINGIETSIRLVTYPTRKQASSVHRDLSLSFTPQELSRTWLNTKYDRDNQLLQVLLFCSFTKATKDPTISYELDWINELQTKMEDLFIRECHAIRVELRTSGDKLKGTAQIFFEPSEEGQQQALECKRRHPKHIFRIKAYNSEGRQIDLDLPCQINVNKATQQSPHNQPQREVQNIHFYPLTHHPEQHTLARPVGLFNSYTTTAFPLPSTSNPKQQPLNINATPFQPFKFGNPSSPPLATSTPGSQVLLNPKPFRPPFPTAPSIPIPVPNTSSSSLSTVLFSSRSIGGTSPPQNPNFPSTNVPLFVSRNVNQPSSSSKEFLFLSANISTIRTIAQASPVFLSLLDFLRREHRLDDDSEQRACHLLDKITNLAAECAIPQDLHYLIEETKERTTRSIIESFASLLGNGNSRLVLAGLRLVERIVGLSDAATRLDFVEKGLFLDIPLFSQKVGPDVEEETMLVLLKLVKHILVLDKANSVSDPSGTTQHSQEPINRILSSCFFRPLTSFLSSLSSLQHTMNSDKSKDVLIGETTPLSNSPSFQSPIFTPQREEEAEDGADHSSQPSDNQDSYGMFSPSPSTNPLSSSIFDTYTPQGEDDEDEADTLWPQIDNQDRYGENFRSLSANQFSSSIFDITLDLSSSRPTPSGESGAPTPTSFYTHQQPSLSSSGQFGDLTSLSSSLGSFQSDSFSVFSDPHQATSFNSAPPDIEATVESDSHNMIQTKQNNDEMMDDDQEAPVPFGVSDDDFLDPNLFIIPDFNSPLS
ncbi:hypothetical protein BLNAU_2195 [Blattamonas nauphoetae]|uniref:RRM domain-containing protein n=1 Tax=Blattamonas nauphoetae TaxID=2049346 RepID=A0ABQ9YG74_9EUKA|nr:hypothetical protein BLNAU_2195 [Blattamonas nauphoetae]